MASLTAAANSLLDRLSSVGDALYTKIKHKIYGDRSNLPPRTIYINIRPPKDKFNHKGAYTVRYVSNEIHTTKYNIFTFIPKNLFEQFRRLANFYFLALVILQSISIFEVGSPLYAAAPITFIVFVTAVKDGFEDYRRHLSDIEINGSTAKTLGGYVNCNYLGVRDGWWKKMWKLVTYYYRGLLGRRKRYGVRSGQVHLVNLNDHEMNAIASTSSESEIDPAALDQHRPSLKTLSSRSSSVDSREDDNEEIPSGNLSIVDAALRQSQQQQQPKQVKLKKRKKKRRKKTAKPKPQGWQPRHWEDLMVGDLIFLRNNDSVPADIVLLNTSEPDGVCYVETKNLDGETNLKIRSGFKEFSYLDSQQKIQDLHMTIDVEPPNTHLYSFNATINVVQSTISTMQGYDLEAKMAVASEFSFKLPVTIDELLLRGCTLRNTDWVIGVVVYTGEDTRLLMNSGETPSKRSLIEISMNLQVTNIFVSVRVRLHNDCHRSC